MKTIFSEHWYLVKDVRPKLREAIDIFPRQLRGRSWVFLHDQKTQKFLRLTPEAWLVVKMMDGRTDLQTLWENASLSQNHLPTSHSFYQDPDTHVISQHELVMLLSQLYSNDMLQTQHNADAVEMGKRFKKQRFNEFKQSFLNPISIKIPLFHPDKWFTGQQKLANQLYSMIGLLLWMIVVIPAIMLAGVHWHTLTNNLSDRMLSTSNLFILWCTYPIVKAFHEWAHGMAVKAWGGHVREVGLIFVIFMPVPYVDATYSYRFTSKWVRALVAATGVMAELFLGALALYTWLNVESGLISAFAYNVIIIAGVSSLLINGNPLMKYDGYYVLSDLIEIPNLAQRAQQYWVYLSDRYLFGAIEAKPPLGYEKERGWLLIYGLISPFYRLFVIFGMIWLVAKQYFIIGVIMALVSAWQSFGMPIYKAIKHVFTSQTLMKYRLSSKRRLYGLALIVILILFALPLPFYSVQQGVAWLPDDNIVRARVSGILHPENLRDGQPIQISQKIAQLTNTDLSQKYLHLEQEIMALDLKIRQAQSDESSKLDSLLSQQRALQAQLQLLKTDTQALTIIAPTQGYWYAKAINNTQDSYVKKGDIIGYVMPKQTNLVRVIIEQNDMNLIEQRLQGIHLKTRSNLTQTYTATIIQRTPKASFELPNAALGINAGGNIIIDPNDSSGTKALERVFDIQLKLNDGQTLKANQPLGVNDRIYVRFDLGKLPIGWQWLIRARQLFLKNFNV